MSEVQRYENSLYYSYVFMEGTELATSYPVFWETITLFIYIFFYIYVIFFPTILRRETYFYVNMSILFYLLKKFISYIYILTLILLKNVSYIFIY